MYTQGRRQAEHLQNDRMEKERMFLPVQLGFVLPATLSLPVSLISTATAFSSFAFLFPILFKL